MSVDELRHAVQTALHASGQASYSRRAPDPRSVPIIRSARDDLKIFLLGAPDCAEAWSLLSMTQEALLEYSEAIASLNRAMELSTRDRKDLKRLARLREAKSFWDQLTLTPYQLHDLGTYLQERGTSLDSERLTATKEWLETAGLPDPEAVLDAFESLGAYSDFQVLENIVRG